MAEPVRCLLSQYGWYRSCCAMWEKKRMCRFSDDDVVRLRDDVPGLGHLAGMLGVVTGTAETDEFSEEVQYAVWFYGFDEIYVCSESELLPTPYRDNVSKRWWSGTSVRVSVDPDSGHGKIVGVNLRE